MIPRLGSGLLRIATLASPAGRMTGIVFLRQDLTYENNLIHSLHYVLFEYFVLLFHLHPKLPFHLAEEIVSCAMPHIASPCQSNHSNPMVTLRPSER